ncbi:hypothetical protein GFV12_02985 [Desulfurobacterium thermolithotrophum]|uniref:hypothetical protein n=1 Tax=Desulfurobacterium thermolithotrophum TaxID=64160 RepID=UPI0013D32BE4|nr:hypothetical protein [Desulfurobacterium thermolithotrophum]
MEVKEISYGTERTPKRRKEVAYCDEGVRKLVEKTPTPEGIGRVEQQQQINLTDLINEYEQLEAQIQELNDRKQQIRGIIYGELIDQNIEETSVITSSGTKFVLRIQKTRRERVDVKLLRADLGEKAEKYITVTESEFLSIRPAKKNQKELR